MSYWKSVLVATEFLNIPVDKTRNTASQCSARKTIAVQLGAEPAYQHPSFSHCLVAAFQVFLLRLSSQELITLGVQPLTLLNTDAPESFAKTPLHQQLMSKPLEAILPLACPLVQPQDSLNSLNSKLQQLVQQLAQHADTSLQQILTEMGHINTSDAHHPLFQAGLVIAGRQQGGLQAAAAVAADLDVALLWCATDSGDGPMPQQERPSLHLLYDTGVLHEESAALLAEHFKVFLTNALSQPDAPLLDLPLMGEREQLQVVRGFNQTDRKYDTSALVHSKFAQQAASAPDAVAVVYEGVSCSYAEINQRANRIANHLLSLGVGPSSIVGVLLLRSPNMIAALLGVWKSGASYLPLDHQHPEARIALMLEDAGVQVVLVQPDLLCKLPPQPEQQRMGLTAVQLSAHELGEAAAAEACWSKGELNSIENSCYVIYTSGSTGKPKGCQVTHAGLTAYIAWFHSHFGITAADVFIQKTPTNFDASVDEMWAALAAGATLVVAPPEAHRDVHTVMDLITRHKVTTASFVPSQLHVLAREIMALHSSADIAAGAAPCASLKRVLSGGEALTSTAAADITAALPHCQLWNTYGPTETTVGITCWLYDPASAGTSNTVPIGRGIHNSRLYVLDSKMQPVPIGVPGQLFISGVCVSAGYVNRPDLNAEVFVPNPFHHMEELGSRTSIMYRTGDLVRWLPGHKEGVLEFLGRIDHQVKLRGFRIELQEVEAAAAALPGVCQVATAVVRSSITQQDHLAAWISPDNLDSRMLTSSLAERLPHYMIPTVIVPLAALPLLPSEKINRKALPAPDWSRHMVTVAAVGTAADSGGSSKGLVKSALHSVQSNSDPLLQYLQSLWADILGLSVADVTSGSDFFTCGGNSLLVGVMNSRVRARLSAPAMSGLLLYQHPSLEEFAAAVRTAVGQLPSDLVACNRRNSHDSYDRLVITTSVGGSDGGSSSSSSDGAQVRDSFMLDGTVKSDISEAWGTAQKLSLEDSSQVCKQQQKAQERLELARMLSATLLQAIGAVFGLSVQFLMGLAPLLIFEAIFIQWSWKALALQPVVEFVLLLVHLFVAWAAKWILVGRYKEGVHGIYGSFYIRHWLATLLAMDARVYTLPLLKRTVLLNYYYRAMGMKVSSTACIQSIEIGDHDLVTLEDGACLEPRTIVSAATYTARQSQDAKKYPFGTMILKAVRVGKNATVATQTQVNSCTIPEGAVVEPCSASSHPAQACAKNPTTSSAAVRTADKPLGAAPAVLAVVVFCVVSSIMYMPAIVGSILIWDQLTDSTEDVLDTISTALQCWFRLPDTTMSELDICSQIMVSELISILPYIGFLYIMGQVAVVAMIPIKWLLLGKVTPAKAQQQNSWWHFRLHLYSCLVDHPLVRLGAFLWSGTEMFNMWLRGLGMKVGRQAWIGEDLMCNVPDLIEIGDCVSVTSGVGMFPVTSAAAKTIKLHPGCDVTNQTALFPGVQVKPKAVVGVLTYAAEDRTFKKGSITQGSLVLRPGEPDPSPNDEETGSRTLAFMGRPQLSPVDEAISHRLVSQTRYVVFNVLYALAIWVLVPLSDAMFTIPLYTVVLAALYQGGLLLLVAAMPIAFMVAVAFLLTWLVLVKRLLIPRCEGSHRLYTYKPTAWMMYGIVLLVHESTLIRGLMGSQLGVWFYRALGAKIGSNTCLLGPLYNQEPDCVSIGDYTVMEEDSFVMAHTVEDRRLKFLDVKIGKCVSVGAGSCIMPGASVEDGAFIGDVSLVMKGEVVPAGCHWSGVPAVPHEEDAPTMF